MKIELDDNILTKFIAGECSVDEINEIEKQLETNSEAKARFKELAKVWDASGKKAVYQNPEEAWIRFIDKTGIEDNVNKYPSIQNKTIFSTKFIRYAAAVLILILPLLYILNDSNIDYKNVEVGFGQRQKVTLSDGTIITLDSGSKLAYPESFGDYREVILNGEAFFEVAKNPAKPFIVNANQGEIKVLGTKFNVRSWQSENKVHLAVSEGKVSFVNNVNDADTVFLTKGEFSIIDSILSPTRPELVSNNKITGWMNNEKYFEDVPLSEILQQLERWYDVDIELNDKSALNQILSITTSNNGYRANVDLIALVTGLTVEYKDGKVVLN